MPVTITVLASLGLIVLISRFHKNLIYAVIPAIFFLALTNGFSFSEIWDITWERVSSVNNLFLMLVIVQVIWLSQQMKDTGVMDELVTTMQKSVSKKASMAMLPAAIGILPMPGGALFSAPLVDDCDHNKDVDPLLKTRINYWFRHIWEYWWPLYPGVILAVALMEVKTWHFIAMMAVMTPVSILAGIFFILRPIGKIEVQEQGGFSWVGLREFIWEMMPILLVILFIFLLPALLGVLEVLGIRIDVDSGLSLLPGLAIAIIWVWRVNRVPVKQFLSVIFGKGTWIMVFLILAVMIFKGMMEDSKAVMEIRNELMAYHIPVMLIILIMPFLSGLITGIAVGFVGAAFPIIIPMIHSPDLIDFLSTAGLAYVFGYMGMILSPVHLCFLVSKDYYKAGFLESYQYVLKPGLTVIGTAVILFVIQRAL